MMGVLLKREGLPPFADPSSRPKTARLNRPLDTWMGVYLPGPDGRRIGFVNTNAVPEIRHGKAGASLNLTAHLRLNLLDMPTDMHITGNAWLPHDTGLATFGFRVRSEDHSMRIAGEVEDGLLKANIYTAGEEIPLEFPVGEELLVSGVMGTTALNVPHLEPGEEVFVDAFDPMMLSMGRARITCVGEETIEAAGERVKTKVLETDINGIKMKAWITEAEEVVRAETPFGFSLRKISPREAIASLEEGDSSDLYEMAAVTPTGVRPFRGARRMVFRVAGIPAGNYPPTDGTQKAIGDKYTTIPPSVPGQIPPDDGGLDAFLASDAFVQTHHAKIQATARQIIGAEPDRWQRALRIYEWVYANIEKVPVLSIPSALDVLETGEGDCNEHTVLFAALARAAGVPTRIAIGLTWSDEFGGFYYHAWPEIHAGGWIWMDPTLGQPIADASHIKLLNGNIEAWPQLLAYLGQLRIEVLEIE